MNSILFHPSELDPHPRDYATSRQQYFDHISRLSSEATVKHNRIPLLTAYNHQHRQLQDALKQKKIEQYKYLHPDTYSSIFDNPVEHQNNEQLK